MSDLIVPPDAIPAVRSYLSGVEEVLDLLEGDAERISTKAKAIYPSLTLQQFGDVLKGRWLDSVSLHLDAWGTDRSEASLLGRTVQAALLAIRNHVSGGVVLTGADQELGLAWEPDTGRNPPTPRYVFGVVVHFHADPAVIS